METVRLLLFVIGLVMIAGGLLYALRVRKRIGSPATRPELWTIGALSGGGASLVVTSLLIPIYPY